MEANGIKAIIAIALAAAAAYFQNIAIPMAVLWILMFLDWVTGMVNAWMHHELDSKKGVYGAVKKVFYMVVIVVGIVADYLIISVGKQIGLAVPEGMTFIGLLVTIWLILNESISILENLGKMGTPMPAFLKKLIERLKQTTEEKGEAK